MKIHGEYKSIDEVVLLEEREEIKKTIEREKSDFFLANCWHLNNNSV